MAPDTVYPKPQAVQLESIAFVDYFYLLWISIIFGLCDDYLSDIWRTCFYDIVCLSSQCFYRVDVVVTSALSLDRRPHCANSSHRIQNIPTYTREEKSSGFVFTRKMAKPFPSIVFGLDSLCHSVTRSLGHSITLSLCHCFAPFLLVFWQSAD